MDDQSQPVEDDEQFEQGKIVVKFTVNTRGRARDFEIIESQPPGLEDMEKAVLQEMHSLIYRPRLEDGQVVDTENMTYTHEFFYRESDLPGYEEQPEGPVVEPGEEVAAAGG